MSRRRRKPTERISPEDLSPGDHISAGRWYDDQGNEHSLLDKVGVSPDGEMAEMRLLARPTVIDIDWDWELEEARTLRQRALNKARERAIKESRLHAIWHAKLTRDQRLVLAWMSQGETFEKIAEAMKKSVADVQRIAHRAAARLQKQTKAA